MSAWPEAIYVIREMRKALISADALEKLINRHTVVDKIAIGDGVVYPASHMGQEYSEEALWLITDDGDELIGNYKLSVIDTKYTTGGGNVRPEHKKVTDEYVSNSVWLITDT